MTQVASASAGTATPAATRSAWWVRALAAIPFPVFYAFAHFLAFLALRVFPHRQHVIKESLAKAFPELDDQARFGIMRDFYRRFAEVFVEIVKAASMSPDAIRSRVKAVGIEAVKSVLDGGSPVILVAAHQCNWEWMVHTLSLQLGYRVDAAYKPLVDAWAEREMFALRTRFGSRMIPAQNLLADIIKQKKTVRAIALLADQEPKASEHKHWTRFLNRDTAFYTGPEEIARATRFPVFFIGMKRTSPGYYEMSFSRLLTGPEPGHLTEEYARRVEAQIHASPPDYPWSHKRWRLKKGIYGKG
jgi:KDO2-lipid IV(A) lauroyltransferase